MLLFLLFFTAVLVPEVWSFFYTRAHISPPSVLKDGLRWLKDPTKDKKIILLICLSYQAEIYLIWKERNSQLHSGASRQLPSSSAKVVQLRLDPLCRDSIF